MYNNDVKFEWDPQKSSTNRLKHKIDFESAKSLWGDTDRIEIRAPHPLENRYILIGKIGKQLWSAVYTLRGETIRMISVRRSKKQEMKLYEQEKTRKEQ